MEKKAENTLSNITITVRMLILQFKSVVINKLVLITVLYLYIRFKEMETEVEIKNVYQKEVEAIEVSLKSQHY